MSVPLGFPLSSLTTTAALSSNLTRMPSLLLYSFFCRTMIAYTTFFLMSGAPTETEAVMKAPTPPDMLRALTPFPPLNEIILRSFAPELSQVGM